MRKSPEQDVFDWFFKLSLNNGYDTYDYLPPEKEKVSYPFVYIGNVQGVPNATKTELVGSVYLNIDIWGTRKQRLTINQMVERFFHASIGYTKTPNFQYYGQPNQQSKRMQLDTSVPNTVLMRGLLEIKLNIL
ncbi:MAG: hypothetical protein [Caudoviricetes sp.]|nr:MAG: hypothetical protein [Caudoviricetes sp.]